MPQVGLPHKEPVTIDIIVNNLNTIILTDKRKYKIYLHGDNSNNKFGFEYYQTNNSDAIKNAGKILKETGAQSVKLEGGIKISKIIEHLIKNRVQVMGHLGILPQSITGNFWS